MSDSNLAARLTELGYQELFLFLDRSSLQELWTSPGGPARLRDVAEDPAADPSARFLAAEAVWERDPADPPRAADLGAVYAAALRDATTGVANPWGLPGAGNGVVAGHVAALDPRSAAPPFVALLADDAEVLYAGSQEATDGNRYRYRVKDIAAELVARLLGLPYDVLLDPADRDTAIDRLRTAAEAVLDDDSR
jgi:hypothetical protein